MTRTAPTITTTKKANEQLAHKIDRLHQPDEDDEPALEHSMVAMMDALQCLGVSALDACRFSASCSRTPERIRKLYNDLDNRRTLVGATLGTKPSFMEIYGTGNIVQSAQAAGGCLTSVVWVHWSCAPKRSTAHHGWLTSPPIEPWLAPWLNSKSRPGSLGRRHARFPPIKHRDELV